MAAAAEFGAIAVVPHLVDYLPQMQTNLARDFTHLGMVDWLQGGHGGRSLEV
jgi:hypothetical protein